MEQSQQCSRGEERDTRKLVGYQSVAQTNLSVHNSQKPVDSTVGGKAVSSDDSVPNWRIDLNRKFSILTPKSVSHTYLSHILI